jgi:hypothetical protein
MAVGVDATGGEVRNPDGRRNVMVDRKKRKRVKLVKHSAPKLDVRPPAKGSASSARFDPRLAATIAGIHFDNPVWTASGTFGYGKEFAHLIDLNMLGGIVVKGISAEPMEGNPAPRIYETDSGMLNAIGLQNVGARRFLKEKLPFLRTLRTRCIVNVFGFSTDDYVRCI